MLELPEAAVMAKQISAELKGKTIVNVYANSSPHKFAWFHGDPLEYGALLRGKTIEGAAPHGGMVEIKGGEARLVFGDGVNLRYFPAGEKLPAKHQLRVEFADACSLVGSVQMYGGLWAFLKGEFDNPYYSVAREKPSPLGEKFDHAYFELLLAGEKLEVLSAKAFLATAQRIPGLGNGVLQDILWNARVHPKRKMADLSASELRAIFDSVKACLAAMAAGGGRDTERDLYGCPGGYRTVLSKNTLGQPCPACGTPVKKEAYMGGSIYFCPQCQPL